jgi:hypothetical protein
VVLLGRLTRDRSCWTSWTYGRRQWSRIGSLCQLLREPQGFPAHGLSLLCSRACAAETRSAHPRSLLQDRHAWSHLLRAVPVLLSHHWPLTCSRVACCLARALACGIEPSRPPVEHSRSHPRTRRSNSARTSEPCNSAVLSTCCDTIRAGLPPPPVLRCASNPRCVAPASTFAWMKGARRAWLHLAPPSSSHPITAFALPPSPSDLPCHNRSSASARVAVCLL